MSLGHPNKNWSGASPDALRGMAIYGSGDTIAALILDEFLWTRLLGMMLVGGILYAWEVPHWFRWIDRGVPAGAGWKTALRRTALAMLYFNPLWIARHLAFIALFSGDWVALNLGLVDIGVRSFIVNIPLALLANWAIQNRLSYRRRFVASALFSALMAIYYALSSAIFGSPSTE